MRRKGDDRDPVRVESVRNLIKLLSCQPGKPRTPLVRNDDHCSCLTFLEMLNHVCLWVGNRNRNTPPTTLAYNSRLVQAHRRLRSPACDTESNTTEVPGRTGLQATSCARKWGSPSNPCQSPPPTRRSTQMYVVSSSRTKSSDPARDIASASALALECIHRNLSMKSSSTGSQQNKSTIISCMTVFLARPRLNESCRTLLFTSRDKR